MQANLNLLPGELPYMLDGLFYYYGEEGNIVSVDKPSEVPDGIDGNCVSFWTIERAITWLNMKGCSQISQHNLNRDDQLAIDVVKIGVEKYGEIFSALYRGIRSDRPEKKHKVLFATQGLDVAQFYGPRIKEYTDIRGLRTVSFAQSVLVENNDDDFSQDEEIIFFHEHNQNNKSILP